MTRPISEIPGPPSYPVIGSLPSLLGPGGVVGSLQALAERYREHGCFRLVTPGGVEHVFVVSVALAAELFDQERYAKAVEGPLLRIREFAGDGLFTAHQHEDNWHRAHRILAPGFTAESMDRYFPTMRVVLEDLLASWRRRGQPIDVVKDMTRLTLDTISLCGFNHAFRSFETEELHPFLQALGRALQDASDHVQRPPSLAWLFRRQERRFRADVQTMFALVDDVIARRKRAPATATPARDFLSLMLAQAEPLSDENIRSQVLTFLVAGHETSAGLLSFALHRLASDPSLCAAVRAEVEAVFGEREPTRVEVQSLNLVLRTLSETLRMWPTVGVLMVAPGKDEVLGGRWEVPRGRLVHVLLGALHRDPAVWPEPDRFDPDRFLPEVARTRPAAAYKPFGNGRRSCIGRMFALVEAALAIALIVREFELEPAGPLRVGRTLSPKPAGFRLRVRPRRRPGTTRGASAAMG